MARPVLMLVVGVALAGLVLLCGPGEVQARGCLKGAAVGAVAGHLAGHHGVVGAVAGCAVGHHLAKKQQREQRQQQQQSQTPRLVPQQPAPDSGAITS
jgi:hypothetical protein